MRVSSNRWQQIGLLSLAAAAALWVWLLAVQPVFTAAMGVATPLVNWLRSVWSSSEDMGHGPFLPLVSLYVVFLRRKAIVTAIGKPDARGLGLVFIGAFIFWVGLKTEDVRICLTALVLWTWAIPFAVYGAGVAGQLVFPSAYLLLCVPIDSLVIFFTMKLRLLAAIVAVGVANGIGIATERIGTGLHSTAGAGFNLDVAEPCSGLRSIFAMTALAAAYAFFTQKTLWRQWALFACAIPVAVLGNVVRIVTITIVAAWLGEKTATGFYHDYSGYIVFLVAILLLMEMGYLISRWKTPEYLAIRFGRPERDLGRAAGPSAAAPAARDPLYDLDNKNTSVVLLGLTPIILLACVLLVRWEPAVTPGPLDFLPHELPAEVGHWHGSPVWHCRNEQCMRTFTQAELNKQGAVPLSDVQDGAAAEPWPALKDLQPRYACSTCETGQLFSASLGEANQLPPDTRILRSRYSAGGSADFTVTLVISGTGRNSIHRPELCLPAQGFVMNRITVLPVPTGRAGESMMVNRVDLERKDRSGSVLQLGFIYWFFTGERQTASNVRRVLWSAWDRAFRHQATRWVMVSVTSDQTSAYQSDDLLNFSAALMRQLKAKKTVVEEPVLIKSTVSE